MTKYYCDHCGKEIRLNEELDRKCIFEFWNIDKKSRINAQLCENCLTELYNQIDTFLCKGIDFKERKEQ